MTTKRHSFEGWANGTTVTTGNTGSGDPLDSTSTPAGGSLTAQSSAAVYGSRGAIAAVGGTAAGCWVAFTINAANATGVMHGQISLPVPASIPQSTAVLRGMDAADTAQRFRVQITAAGILQLWNNANTVVATGAIDHRGTSVRIAAAAEGVTSGAATVKVFAASSRSDSSPIETLSATAQNFGGPIRVIRGGIPAASGTNNSLPFDDFGASDEGPLGPSANPTGVAVAAATGGPATAIPTTLPAGAALPATPGSVSTALAGATPSGAATTVSLGSPRAGDRPSATRPSTGATIRPATGTITRPNTGLVTRP